MGLLENIITLVNKYFYKTEEKPVKYHEWLASEYINGIWYINVNVVEQYVESFKYVIVESGRCRVYIEFNTSLHNQKLKTNNSVISESYNANIWVSRPTPCGGVAIEVTIIVEPYFDEETNTYYTGCAYIGTPEEG